MHAEGRALGVDRWIVFPFLTQLAPDVTAFRDNEIKDEKSRLRDVSYAFENRRLLEGINEQFPAEGKRMRPFLMVDSMRTVAAQATGLRKLRANFRFCDIRPHATIVQVDIKLLKDRGNAYRELAAGRDLPFLIRSSVAERDVSAQASEILDIARANPRLRFCLAHSCCYDKECRVRVYARPNTWFVCSPCCIHGEGAVEDLPYMAPRAEHFDSDFTAPAHVIADLAAVYPHKFMRGSDSPFYSYAGEIDGQIVTLISTYQAEVAALTASPPDVVQRIANTES